MCEARMRKAKIDIRTAKRRTRQLRQMRAFVENPTFPPPADLPHLDTDSESDSDNMQEDLSKAELPEVENSAAQAAHLQLLADATLRLMYRNSDIQRRVAELKEDTAEYVRNIMSIPENRAKFVEYFGAPPPSPPAQSQASPASDSAVSMSGEDDESRSNIEEDVKEVVCKEEVKTEPEF